MSSIKIETKRRTVEFGVTRQLNRRMPCLYRMRGAMVEPLAYFRSEEDAQAFNDIIEFMLELFGMEKEA